MPVYEVKTWTATDYSPETGWGFNSYPTIEVSTDKEESRLKYQDRVDQRSLLASTVGAAVKIELRVSDAEGVHPLESTIYDGENILHWFVAYHVPGAHPVEERRYISRVLYTINYHAFMYHWPGKEHIPVMVAETLRELQELLGEDFSMYEYTAE